MAHTINVSQERHEELKRLMKPGESLNDVADRCMKLGAYQINYRKIRNPKQAERNRTARRVLAKAERDPKLAVELGLAHVES